MTIEHPFLKIGAARVFLGSSPSGVKSLDSGIFDPSHAETNAKEILQGEYSEAICVHGLTISFLTNLYALQKSYSEMALAAYQSWKESILALANRRNQLLS